MKKLTLFLFLKVTCGAVDTNIYHIPSNRFFSDGYRFPWPLNRHGAFFSSEEGAQVTLDAAWLEPDQIKIGEMAFPYHFGASSSWLLSQTSLDVPKVIFNTFVEPFQKLTYERGHLWICPTSVASRDEGYQQQLKETYFRL